MQYFYECLYLRLPSNQSTLDVDPGIKANVSKRPTHQGESATCGPAVRACVCEDRRNELRRGRLDGRGGGYHYPGDIRGSGELGPHCSI